MFTGIIEQIATAKQLKKSFGKNRLIISLKSFAKDIKIGESIAVNGACLTVANLGANNLSFDVMDQTLKTTNLGRLRAGSKVNIERALKPPQKKG